MNKLETSIVSQAKLLLTKLFGIDVGKKTAPASLSVERTLEHIRLSSELFGYTRFAMAHDSGLGEQAANALREIEEQYMERFAYAKDDEVCPGLDADDIPMLIYANSLFSSLKATQAAESEMERLQPESEGHNSAEARWMEAARSLVTRLGDLVWDEECKRRERTGV